TVMLNSFQHLIFSTYYETLKRVQGDILGLFTNESFLDVFRSALDSYHRSLYNPSNYPAGVSTVYLDNPFQGQEVFVGLYDCRFYHVDETCAFQANISAPPKGIITEDY
ncbi:MAG: hypothetical protein ACM3MD_03425, partial [Betaproteobacteria bacterium]